MMRLSPSRVAEGTSNPSPFNSSKNCSLCNGLPWSVVEVVEEMLRQTQLVNIAAVQHALELNPDFGKPIVGEVLLPNDRTLDFSDRDREIACGVQGGPSLVDRKPIRRLVKSTRPPPRSIPIESLIPAPVSSPDSLLEWNDLCYRCRGCEEKDVRGSRHTTRIPILRSSLDQTGSDKYAVVDDVQGPFDPIKLALHDGVGRCRWPVGN